MKIALLFSFLIMKIILIAKKLRVKKCEMENENHFKPQTENCILIYSHTRAHTRAHTDTHHHMHGVLQTWYHIKHFFNARLGECSALCS